MERQRIGSLEVSALCLGTMPFGKWVDDETSFAIMDRFVEAGGTFLDTANNYVFWDGGTGDESEEAVGRWLAARGNRDELVVATKVGARPRTPGTGLENAEGLSGGVVRAAAEASLKRLGTDRVDHYQLHRPDPETPVEETLGALAELAREGKISEPGASAFSAAQLDEAATVAGDRSLPPFASVQNHYSLLTRTPESDGVLSACARHGIAFVPFFPLGSAFPGTPKVIENAAVVELADELGATEAQVGLAWLLHHAENILLIPGTSSVEHLDENVGAAALTLRDDEVARLDALG